MTDLHEVIRSYLLSATKALTDLVGTRVYAGRDVPPKTYAMSDGACLVFKVRGGNGDYEDAVYSPSVQFKSYGSSEYEAGRVDAALADALHLATSTDILHAQREGFGTPLEEPDTDWPFVLSYYLIMVRNND